MGVSLLHQIIISVGYLLFQSIKNGCSERILLGKGLLFDKTMEGFN